MKKTEGHPFGWPSFFQVAGKMMRLSARRWWLMVLVSQNRENYSFLEPSPSFLPFEQLSADLPEQQEALFSPASAVFEEQHAACDLLQEAFSSLLIDLASFEQDDFFAILDASSEDTPPKTMSFVEELASFLDWDT
jgi:hypothetical protein